MNIPSGWSPRPLSEFILLQRGFDLPHRSRVPGPYKVLSSGVASGSHNEGPIRGPGFVVGRATNIGRPTWSDENYWPLNTVLYAKDFMGNEPKFAYYWFLATDLTGFNSGSVQPMLNRNYIANIPIAVPPLDEQRGIAATLSALDDKIESNRRARSKIRALGLSLLARAQADGCDNKRLSDITLSIARGITPKYANDDHEAPWVINQKCVRDNWVSTSLARRMVDRPVADTRRASSGDILVNSTGTGTLGRVGRWHKGNVYVDSHVTIVKGDPVKVGPTTLAFLMFVREKDIEGMATGSTGQTELSATRLGELKLPVPRQNAEKLESTLQKFEDWAAALTAEEASLHKLRDTLLPELVSGRIRVPEATEAVK